MTRDNTVFCNDTSASYYMILGLYLTSLFSIPARLDSSKVSISVAVIDVIHIQKGSSILDVSIKARDDPGQS